jgi:hypothetical protein
LKGVVHLVLAFNLSEKLVFESGMSITEIAKKIDMPKGQLSSYLSSEGKKTVDIMYGLRLVRMVSPEHEEEYMKAICPKVHRPQNLRNGLEYASTFMYFDLMREMIEVNQKGNRENRDWAEIYSIYLDFQENGQDINVIKERLNDYQPKFLETEIFYGIFMSSIFYVEKRYDEMYKWSKELYKQVGFVKNDFVRESYMSRICDLIARSYLFYKNDTKKASFFAKTLLDNEFSANRKYHAYYILALCHFFLDYDRSYHYFRLYYKSMMNIGNEELANIIKNKDIMFLRNVWNKIEEGVAPTDLAEAAHYYAKNGQTDLALSILDQFETLTPFQKYYKALALDDPKLLSESFVDFLTSGNKFFANLPLKELKKYKTYDFFAELLYNKIGS